jgi:hypothetical protein
MRRSLYHNVKQVNGFTSATISTNATTTGATVDLAQSPGGDWRTCLWLVFVGTRTDGTLTLKVQESDDDSSYTDVTNTNAVQGPSGTITTTGGSAEIGYTGSKRYCRLAIVSTGMTTGITLVQARALLSGSAAYKR